MDFGPIFAFLATKMAAIRPSEKITTMLIRIDTRIKSFSKKNYGKKKFGKLSETPPKSFWAKSKIFGVKTVDAPRQPMGGFLCIHNTC